MAPGDNEYEIQYKKIFLLISMLLSATTKAATRKWKKEH